MLVGIVIGIILSIGILLVVVGVVAGCSQAAEQARIDGETRLAQHRLHQLAQDGMQAMLDEARRHQFRQ
jgi:hypothetical protein